MKSDDKDKKITFANLMKKAGVILLLFVITFQMVGVFLLFKAKQMEVRQDMKMKIKSGVPDAELTILRFSRDQADGLKWMEDHEFRYEGRMYDVVKTTVDGEIVIYHCIHDEQESKLFSHLDNMVANELAKDKNTNPPNYQLVVNWYFPDNLPQSTDISSVINTMNFPYRFISICGLSIPETPPPNC